MWRKLTLYRLEEVASMLQTSIGTVVRLRSKPHGSAIAASGTGLLIVGTACVPGEANKNLYWQNLVRYALFTQKQKSSSYR